MQTRRVAPTNSFIEFKKAEIEQSIPDRFEKIVRMYPERVAIKTENHVLTYAELNAAANRVARAILAQRGRGSEPVALLLERGAPMIAGILGVLKAGKIYVPLDPASPPSRLTFMLADSQAGLIVSDNTNLSFSREIADHPYERINVDEVDANISTENLALSISPDAIAWILYTSGTTGDPKGVFQNHRNVLHLIMRYTNRARVTRDDRIGLVRSFSVNGGTLHTFGALLNGAQIVPFGLKHQGMTKLAHWLIDEQITLCSFSPTILRHLVETLRRGETLPNLRVILFSGEPLYRKDLELCRAYFSENSLFINSLGTTEASNACDLVIDGKTQIQGEIVPCGYPTTDMKILLLDDNKKEVDANQIGEIAIKSQYLTLGYWQRPDLTVAKFLRGPGAERIYLTGDLGRRLADGCLVHLGRKDFQVKIRGHRVEVAEVEAALLGSETIEEAVVVAREDRAGDPCLVAYVVPSVQPWPTVSAVRRVLAQELPDYMIPSSFVMMEALPLTPNSKVDRRALPEPSTIRPSLDAPFVPPRTPVEQLLSGIWTEVLGLDRVGIHDNFLDLGGNSLLAARVISRILAALHVDLPMRSLFDAPTIAEMAAVIACNQGDKVDRSDLFHVLTEMESLSDEEAQRFLAEEESSRGHHKE